MATSPKKNLPAPVAPTLEEPDIAPAPVSMEEAAQTAVVEPPAEIHQSVRTALDKGVADTRAAFAKAKTSADETASAFELSFAAAKEGAIAINAKALEALRTNTESNFNFLKASFAVKSLSDLIVLQGEFARKQVDAMTVQVKDIGALAQKSFAASIEPLKERFVKTFKPTV